ncbi:MAG: gamma carbonic anhydrase family protein [Gammaproteobacteria bacterium]|nr:gamma carbonic anhydrase family protein [Gammaproteobacteria bacterium]NND38016.1 gamma carbonic anhydrase family protein [Pseudomonadales bacterium]NNL11651.1 gamma carbonic anhydrase family protein [Pseudomonadales bacterium]NNM12284.1 gamma carbonic anhydrase family protein [Pseudomonadales bacterium]
MIYQLDDQSPQLIGEGHFVAPNASVIGDVTLQTQVGVWFGVVIRGDVERVEIGARSNVQDNSVLHADPGFPLLVGEDVTIGHKTMVHGCTIGDGSLVGINAVVLNGARIGRNCVIGAGAVVTENTEVPDGSMVLGCPGKVVKQLSEEMQHAIALGAAHYVENAARYAKGLKPL